jgi:HEAT repeat protein
MGDEQAVEPLIAALHDPSMLLRRYAAIALGKIGPISIDPLVATLLDTDVGVRVSAAHALALIGKPAVPKLIDTLQHEEPLFRVYAAHALGEIGAEEAIEPLRAALGDSDQRVSRSVQNALNKFT